MSGREVKGVGFNWALLVNVYNDLEADIVEGLLEQHNVPVLRKYPGSGQYMKVIAGTVIDVDIYVPDILLEEARSVMEAFTQAGEN